jgi:uncharacterized protein (DUF2132 family)
MEKQVNNPLHGITLEAILKKLVEHYGWEGLNKRIELRCFFSHPSIKSSLIFLRKNLWAREKVEKLFMQMEETMEEKDKYDKS